MRLNTEDFFLPKTQVFQKKNVSNRKQRDRFLHRFLEMSRDIAVDFTSEKHQSFLMLKVFLGLAAKWSSNNANDLFNYFPFIQNYLEFP